jgi:aminoglycoside phosphotransferase family enzyme
VFLAGEFVYKLKKPVRTPVLDFSTLARRADDCELEIRLNHRLAPHIYLDVVPLWVDASTGLRIAWPCHGPVVDWLVQMRRLPRGRMLGALVSDRRLTAADSGRVAGRLARFYRALAPIAVDPDVYHARLLAELDRSRARLVEAAICADLLPPLLARLEVEHREAWPELASRVGRGWVREGHGDLRPEHICVLDEPVVIDCLEFSRDLRLLDPADDLSVLGIECDLLGAPEVGDRIAGLAWQQLGAAPSTHLWRFFKAVRALVRARLAADHLDGISPQNSLAAYWRERAATYVRVSLGLLFE